MNRTLASFSKCRRGTVAIEFAAVGGFAVFVLLAGVEYATWIRDQRSVASAAAAAAESISDSASSSTGSRDNLQSALKIMSAGNGTDMGLNVYHVTSASDGTIAVSDTWSTGSSDLPGAADPNEWRLISAYLIAGEGGVVACAYKMHYWRFMPLIDSAGMLVKSCSAGVPVEVADIDWQ